MAEPLALDDYHDLTELTALALSPDGERVAFVADEFDPEAAEHGIYDFYSNFGTDDSHLWHEDESGLPWERADAYRDISSLTRVDRIETLLLTAGEEDWRCPPPQAELCT